MRIAEHLPETLRPSDASADVVDLDAKAAPPLDGYDGLLLGGSVRGGRYRRSLRRLLRRPQADLARTPWAFFSVCLTIAATGEDARAEARALPGRFHGRRGPGSRRGGRVRRRAALQPSQQARHAPPFRDDLPDTDMDHEWEYTDWDEVDALARRLLAIARTSRHATAPAEDPATSSSTSSA